MNASDTNKGYLESRLRYSLITWSSLFSLSLDDGFLYLLQKVDSDEDISLTVAVSDWLNPTETSLAEIKIAPDHVNCVAVDESFYDITMARDASNVTSFVLKTSETSPFSKDVFFVVLTLPESSNQKVTVNPRTGVISLKPGIDVGLTIVLIGAYNGPCLPSFTLLSILRNLVDREDHSVRLVFGEYFVSLTENLPIGSYVTTVKAFLNQSRNAPAPSLLFQLMSAEMSSRFFKVDENSGQITTNLPLTNVGTELTFSVKVEVQNESLFQSATALVKVILDPEPKQPVFPVNGFHFEVNLESSVDDVVGNVNSRDEFGRMIPGVTYYWKEMSEYFSINKTTGDVKLIKSIVHNGRTKRSKSDFPVDEAASSELHLKVSPFYDSIEQELTGADGTSFSHRRVSRDVTNLNTSDSISTIVMIAIARSGFKVQKEAETTVSVKINKTCTFNCSTVAPTDSKGSGSLSGTPLILLIVFLSVGIVILAVFLGLLTWCLIKRKISKNKTRQSSVPAITIEPKREITFHNQSYTADLMGTDSSSRQHAVRSNLPSQTRSESSGRGSVLERDADEEIRMINAASGRISSRCSSSGTRQKYSAEILPDSGIPDEDKEVDEEENERGQIRHPLSQAKSAHISRVVVENGTTLRTSKSNQTGGKNPISVAKSSPGTIDNQVIIHHQNASPAQNSNFQKKHSPRSVLDISPRCTDSASTRTGSNRQMKIPHKPDYRSLIRTLNERILAEPNNWDCVSEWNPNYESLSSVFEDISQLKHEGPARVPSPKKVPTKIVPQVRQPQQNYYDVISTKNMPPPIITDAPPPSVPLATHPALVRTRESSPKLAISAEEIMKRSDHWSSPVRRPVFQQQQQQMREVQYDPRMIASSEMSIMGSQDSVATSDGLKRRLKNPRNPPTFIPLEHRSIPMSLLSNSSSKADPSFQHIHATTSFSRPFQFDDSSGMVPSRAESNRPVLNIAFITPDSEFDI